MAEESLPPQMRKLALYSAGGGFGGALLAIVVARILAGPCCCQHPDGPAKSYRPAMAPAVVEILHRNEGAPGP